MTIRPANQEIKTKRRGSCPVLFLDGKLDMGMALTAMELGAQEGWTVKVFCPFAGVIPRTHAFNFFDDLQTSGPGEVVSEILGVLNLYSGDDYGRRFFYDMCKELVENAVYSGFGQRLGIGQPFSMPNRRLGPPNSFRDLRSLMRHVIDQDEDRYRNATHVFSIVEGLARFDLINMTAESHPDHPALKGSIRFAEVVEHRQLVYCILPASLDTPLAGFFASMMLRGFKNACKDYLRKTGRHPNGISFADEAQILFGLAFASSLLTQCRSFGLGVLMAHQDHSQAVLPGGGDLNPALESNTAVKIYLSVRDLDQKKKVSQNSGTVIYGDVEYEVGGSDYSSARLAAEHAAPGSDGVTRIGVKQRPGPRMELEDIDDINRHPNLCAIKLERNAGLSQFMGTFPALIPWQMSKDEFRRRHNSPNWPAPTEGTVSFDELMKQLQDQTVPAQDPEEKARLEDSLRDLEDQLRGGTP